mmetsp:Transcript_1622/g.2470  ORF Transcript_1622/g.2470 Transcript_1622/m.2470 type:complete len:201 (-) Transcript_1622:429-1031(-)
MTNTLLIALDSFPLNILLPNPFVQVIVMVLFFPIVNVFVTNVVPVVRSSSYWMFILMLPLRKNRYPNRRGSYPLPLLPRISFPIMSMSNRHTFSIRKRRDLLMMMVYQLLKLDPGNILNSRLLQGWVSPRNMLNGVLLPSPLIDSIPLLPFIRKHVLPLHKIKNKNWSMSVRIGSWNWIPFREILLFRNLHGRRLLIRKI